MSEWDSLGRLLLTVGGTLGLLGALLLARAHVPWLGHLPGDLILRRGEITFYLPVTTCLLFSLLMTAAFWIIGRMK